MGQINLFVGWILCLANKRKESEGLVWVITTDLYHKQQHTDIIVRGSQLRRSSFPAQWFPSEHRWAGWGCGSAAVWSTGEGFRMSSSHLHCTHQGAAAACKGEKLHMGMCSAFCIQLLHSKILPFRLNQKIIWQAPQRQHASAFIFALHAEVLTIVQCLSSSGLQ